MQKNKLRTGLIVSLISLFATLCSLEVYARGLLGIQPGKDRYRMDAELGWEWNPGYAGRDEHGAVPYYLEISSQGLPGSPEYAIPKPPAAYRILALGDSVTHGPFVLPEETFVAGLQTALQPDFGATRLETLNGGTDNYGLVQERVWLAQRGMRFEPDFVLLTVFLNDGHVPYYPDAFSAAAYNFLYERSAAYNFAYGELIDYMVKQNTAETDFRFRYWEDFEAQAWRSEAAALTSLIQEAEEDWGMAWTNEGLAVIIHDMLDLVEYMEGEGIPFLIALSPASVQVEAETDTLPGFRPLDYPQQQLVQLLQSRGIPFVDLLPVLRPHRAEGLFYDQAHFTPRGHELVAEALAEALRAFGLSP
jgi:lysophospholipase L1-like esterase